MRISLGFAAARASRSGIKPAPADPIKKPRRENMTTSELGSAGVFAPGAITDVEAGSSRPPSARRRGQAPRFSCIYSAPASCSLKSALSLFSRRASFGRQLKINPIQVQKQEIMFQKNGATRGLFSVTVVRAAQ